MTLNGKIRSWLDYPEKMINTKDVKEFINRLKEEVKIAYERNDDDAGNVKYDGGKQQGKRRIIRVD